MDIDLTNLTLSQIAATLGSLAILAFVTGFGRAMAAGTVLWTYASAWLTEYLLPVIVLVILATAGRGIPAIDLPPTPVVGLLFGLAAATWIASTLAAIARNLGLDLTRLPFARRVTAEDVHLGIPPAP